MKRIVGVAAGVAGTIGLACWFAWWLLQKGVLFVADYLL